MKMYPVFLIKHHTMRTYWGNGGEWSASCPGHFAPRERTPSTHWIGGWLVPRADLDVVVKRKFPFH